MMKCNQLVNSNGFHPKFVHRYEILLSVTLSNSRSFNEVSRTGTILGQNIAWNLSH